MIRQILRSLFGSSYPDTGSGCKHRNKKWMASIHSSGYCAECQDCGKWLVGKQNWDYPEQWSSTWKGSE